MQHSFLGLIFNITVLIIEYKRAAFAQTFILGYKPNRPSYFYPDHPGHHPPQIIPQQSQEGWLWPADPDCTTRPITVTTTALPSTATTVVQVPNRRPDLPQTQEGGPLQEISPEINHWFRPVIITNTMNPGSDNKTTSTTTTTTATTTTATTTTTTSAPTVPPSALAITPPIVVQFLPEGDLFTSAPIRSNHIEPSSGAPTTSVPPISVNIASAALPTEAPSNNSVIESPEGNVTLVVADLLPLPGDVAKNGSVENINLLLPLLPLKAPKSNDID